MIRVKTLEENDIPLLVSAFHENNLPKSLEVFESYLLDQEKEIRQVWVAQHEGKYAGYVTLLQHSKYSPFKENSIPEINDLNVLPPYRRCGIASQLLDVAERKAFKISSIIGIGVGLYSDYGSAQRLYVKRGYLPDGKGITDNYKTTPPGKNVCLDDDLVLWFTKTIK